MSKPKKPHGGRTSEKDDPTQTVLDTLHSSSRSALCLHSVTTQPNDLIEPAPRHLYGCKGDAETDAETGSPLRLKNSAPDGGERIQSLSVLCCSAGRSDRGRGTASVCTEVHC